MVDQNSIFGGMLTTLGAAKKTNCDALGIPWEPRYMLIGDANGTDPVPSPSQTKLINQRYRAQLNQLRVSPTDDNVLIAELVLPPDVGGWWIRELALEDKDGVFSAVSNVAPSYKPLLTQGSGRNQVVRMHIITSGTSNIQLKIDPSVVLATREYVDTRILDELSKLDMKQSVRAASTANLSLAGLQTIDGIALVAGDRVLVKNQTAAKDNGPYVAAAGAWTRAKDADSNAEVTPSLTVSVEAGDSQADTIWQLVTDGPIVLGTTPLTFRNITDGFARSFSPTFTGDPTAPTTAQFDSSKSVVTTEFLKRRGLEYADYTNYSASTALTVADVGKVAAFASAGAMVAYLPVGAQIPRGAIVEILCGMGTVTVRAGVGDSIDAVNYVGNIALGQGDTAQFIRIGSLWRLIGGSVSLKYAAVMSGPNWVTPPQFDSGKSLATTEFVKRSGVEYSSFSANSTNLALGLAHVGGLHSFSAATLLYAVLPPTVGIAQGATVTLACAGPGGLNIQAVEGDTLYTSAGASGSIVMGLGDTAEFVRLDSQWRLIGGTVALRFAAVMSGAYFTTPPRFDSNKVLATAEFVQREKGSYANSVAIAGGAVSLTSFHIGARIEMSAAGTLTLPKASTVPKGSQLMVTTTASAGVVNLALQAGDSLAINNVTVPAPYTMSNGSDIVLVSDGAAWRAHASLECLRTSPLFAASFGSVGYSKSPNGEVRMWGLTGGLAPGSVGSIAFPQAFPNGCLNVQMTYVDGGVQAPATRGAPVQVGNYTRTGFSYSHSGSSSASQHFWLAIGF